MARKTSKPRKAARSRAPRAARRTGPKARKASGPQKASSPRRADGILIVDGGRRLPRADILHGNREPGLFSRFSTTQLGGLAIRAALERSRVPAVFLHE